MPTTRSQSLMVNFLLFLICASSVPATVYVPEVLQALQNPALVAPFSPPYFLLNVKVPWKDPCKTCAVCLSAQKKLIGWNISNCKEMS